MEVVRMKKYILLGYRWFDKLNGNTYHTVNIINVDTNKTIYKSETVMYGYGDHWKHTVYNQMIKLNLVSEKDRFNHKLNGERFIYICHDVTRKKELF